MVRIVLHLMGNKIIVCYVIFISRLEFFFPVTCNINNDVLSQFYLKTVGVIMLLVILEICIVHCE